MSGFVILLYCETTTIIASLAQLRLKLKFLFQRFQVEQQFLYYLITFFTIFAQSLRDDANQFRRRVRSQSRERNWICFQNRSEDVAWCLTFEWFAMGHHLVDNSVKNEDIET